MLMWPDIPAEGNRYTKFNDLDPCDVLTASKISFSIQKGTLVTSQ